MFGRHLAVIVVTVILLAPSAALASVDREQPRGASMATNASASSDRDWTDGALIVGTLAAPALVALIIAAKVRRQSRRRCGLAFRPAHRRRGDRARSRPR